MSVWNFEAAEIADSEDLNGRPIYQTPDIREFLAFHRSQKRIISGLKGTGKTLFLKLISHHHRRLGGFALIPADELTERLYSIDYDFSGDRIDAWTHPERWEYVWRTALAVVVLKALRYPLPPAILEVFPESLGQSVGSHLSAALLSKTVRNQQFQTLFPTYLDSPIRSVSQQVALFVDNIDEALARHAGDDLYRATIEAQPQSGTQVYGLWLAGQIGFMLAVRDLSVRNAHLKLFGTVRTEAIRDSRTPNAFNLQASVLDLCYTPDELRGIFETKLHQLRETQPALFPRRDLPNVVDAFFLESEIEHPTVRRDTGEPFKEGVFEYLRRHARGRPRELDFIGHQLQVVPAGQRSPEMVREVVRDVSVRLFRFARSEAVPYWDPRVEQLLERIPSNFITRARAERIATNLFGADGKALWHSLYANGLCGAVLTVHPNEPTQVFAKHESLRELSPEDFWRAPVWVMHPCVNIATRSRKTKYKPNPRNVAGHKYPFVHQKRSMKRHVHVLVGCGRLGLGLVVPSILKAPNTKVLVLARSAPKWKALLNHGVRERSSLEVVCEPRIPRHGRHERVTFAAVSDTDENWKRDVKQALRSSRCVLLVYESDESFRAALALADSIGFSVGSANIETVTRQIKAAVPRRARVVFAYENDAEAVDAAARLLAGQMAVVPTIVDRICSDLRVHEKGIDVYAEEHGSVIVRLDETVARNAPWCFASEVAPRIEVLRDPAEFDFARERKKRLVNALQTSAAALARHMLIRDGVDERVAGEHLLGLLTNNIDINAQLIGLKDLMVLAVLGTMPEGRRDSEALAELVRDLYGQAAAAIERMQSSPDAPSRVLKGDTGSLAAKYERLFGDVEDLVAKALRSEEVRALVRVDASEVPSRLSALKDAFIALFNEAGKKGERVPAVV